MADWCLAALLHSGRRRGARRSLRPAGHGGVHLTRRRHDGHLAALAAAPRRHRLWRGVGGADAARFDPAARRALNRLHRNAGIPDDPVRDPETGNRRRLPEYRRAFLRRHTHRGDVRVDKTVRGHEHVLRLAHDDGPAGVAGLSEDDARRQRRPADVPVAVAPRHPGGSPDGSGHPGPAVPAEVYPCPVVVWAASPWVTGHPRPPVFRVDPSAVGVWLPVAGHPLRHPAPAVTAIDPPAVRGKLVVEPPDRHPDADLRLRRLRRETHRERAENEGRDCKSLHGHTP